METEGDMDDKEAQPAPEAEAIAGDTVENLPDRTIPTEET